MAKREIIVVDFKKENGEKTYKVAKILIPENVKLYDESEKDLTLRLNDKKYEDLIDDFCGRETEKTFQQKNVLYCYQGEMRPEDYLIDEKIMNEKRFVELNLKSQQNPEYDICDSLSNEEEKKKAETSKEKEPLIKRTIVKSEVFEEPIEKKEKSSSMNTIKSLKKLSIKEPMKKEEKEESMEQKFMPILENLDREMYEPKDFNLHRVFSTETFDVPPYPRRFF